MFVSRLVEALCSAGLGLVGWLIGGRVVWMLERWVELFVEWSIGLFVEC